MTDEKKDGRAEDFGEERIFFQRSSSGESPYVRKFIAHALIDEKSINEEKREIEGYASTKFEDRDEDIILPEAFETSTEAYLKDGVVLLFHDPRAPVGKPVSVKMTATGIKLKTKILEGFAEADKAWTMIKAGAIRAYSIGFRTLDARWEDHGTGKANRRVRVITALEWIETSLVSIPSNRHSYFSVAKGLNLGDDLNHEIERLASHELQLDETTKTIAELNSEIENGLTMMRLKRINERMRKI